MLKFSNWPSSAQQQAVASISCKGYDVFFHAVKGVFQGASKATIPDLYNKVRADISKALEDFVTLTTDMWSTTNIYINPYMSVTAHYVTESWELQAKCLETTNVPDDYTAMVLAKEARVRSRMGTTEEKESCVTTDNEANIVNTIRNLNWPWLNCFGHNLHIKKEKAESN